MQLSVKPVSFSKFPAVAEEPSRLRWTAAILALCVVAISSESLWIDELCTAYFAGQPSLKAMWQELIRFKWPELQAPLYMAYMWVWEHVIGNREWVLRVAGVPWYLLGAVVFVGSFRKTRQRIIAALILAVHPFVWFYLNEARPYSMELGFAFLLFGALVHLYRLQDETGFAQVPGWLALACLSALALSLISALGMIWCLAAILALPGIFSRQALQRFAREHYLLLGGTMLVLVLGGSYYLWTRWLGTEPSRVVARTDWRSLLFIVYELLGFNGLGPGRLALREVGIMAVKPWLGFLVAYGAVISVLGFAGIHELRQQKRPRMTLIITVALCVPLAMLVSLGLLTHFRVLGRHCTPMIVIVAYVLALGAFRLWESGRWRTRAWLVLFLALSLFSSVSQRFVPRHAKDDYRAAAEFAKTCLAQNQTVWWNADTFACSYYRVPASKERPSAGEAWMLLAPPVGFAQDVSSADWVISSKPDSYDWRGGLRQFLADHGYAPVQEFTAFRVFRRPGVVPSGYGLGSDHP